MSIKEKKIMGAHAPIKIILHLYHPLIPLLQ